MQKPSPSKFLWLLVPPLMGLAVYFGPLGGVDSSAAVRTNPEALSLPPTPGLWQVASALVGVLLVGGVAVMLIAKLRRSGPIARAGDRVGILELRQTLRISARHRVHAVEFNDRVLLIGECDNNLAVLSSDADQSVVEDEELLSQRSEELRAGADLRDTPGEKKRLRPKTLASVKGQQRPAPKSAAKTTAARADVAAANLADFKSLLRRARKKASV